MPKLVMWTVQHLHQAAPCNGSAIGGICPVPLRASPDELPKVEAGVGFALCARCSACRSNQCGLIARVFVSFPRHEVHQ
jgi:hypothetical protein